MSSKSDDASARCPLSSEIDAALQCREQSVWCGVDVKRWRKLLTKLDFDSNPKSDLGTLKPSLSLMGPCHKP